MKTGSVGSLLGLFCACVSAACSGEGAAPVRNEASEDAIIEAYLTEQGFVLDGMVIDGDNIIVERDIGFSRQSILELVEELDRLEREGELVEKGYWHDGSPVPPATYMRYSFASNVPAAWRDAFRYGVSQWNASGAECLRLTEDPGNTAAIYITIGDAPTGSVAQGTFPSFNTRLGIRLGRIVVDTSYRDETNVAFMRYVAMHELGHNLGFAHPRAGLHIPSTSSSSTGCSGDCIASYPTVMDYSFSDTTTSSDDRKSARLRYKKYYNGIRIGYTCSGTVLDP